MARTTSKPGDQLAQDDAAATAAGLELSARQSAFVEQYVIDGNGAAAARRAGYAVKPARQIAYVLLARPAVQAAIRAKLAELTERAHLSAEAVIRETGAIAFASLADLVDIKAGRVYLKPNASIPPDVWPAIAELANTEHGIRIKLHPKMPALDKLGQRAKLWEGAGAARVNLTVRLEREEMPSSSVRKVG